MKAASMAHRLSSLLADSNPEDKFIIICNNIHMLYGYGVPERILKSQKEDERDLFRQRMCLLCTWNSCNDIKLDRKKDKYQKDLYKIFGKDNSPSDFCFVCEPSTSQSKTDTNQPLTPRKSALLECKVICPSAEVAFQIAEALVNESLCENVKFIPGRKRRDYMTG